ncbi:hypothetical protein BCR43DRAFT_496662 [Syncephalastrum racemosum]|uniref:BZIP domain-containing protein n=1 Tax=Syncephalastrum racemosum TaxID=13706 RepID=A0A1X2H5P5_SYNRA|nr:hypothetical protein BCR43DRAFT_496662 [Syncephalastrum racemosum]
MYPSPPTYSQRSKHPPIHHVPLHAADRNQFIPPPRQIDHTPPWIHTVHPHPPGYHGPSPPPPGHHSQQPSQQQRQQQQQLQDQQAKQNSRVVIPSKRAAQNRAAQRAFRQRRDRYVKELEEKAKVMEQWQEEMDQLRGENQRLRGTIASLEQRIAELTGQTPVSSGGSSSSSSSSSSSNSSTSIHSSNNVDGSCNHKRKASHPLPQPPQPPQPSRSAAETTPSVPVTSDTPTPALTSPHQHPHASPPSEPSPTSPRPSAALHSSLLPIPLRAPDQQAFPPAPPPPPPPQQDSSEVPSVSASSASAATSYPPPSQPPQPSSAINHPVDPHIHQEEHRQAMQQQPQAHPQALAPEDQQVWAFDNFDFEFAFDSYFNDDDMATNTMPMYSNSAATNNSEQVLDDLFAVLQTRQRPQIPAQLPTPSDATSSFPIPQPPQADNTSSQSQAFIME